METDELPTEAQLLIDKKIVALQQSIQRLKVERNQHTRIARLPPEILGKIFADVVSNTKPKESFSAITLPSTRFNFSFVSQHWRNVGLSTPEIWGILPDGYTEWCQAMLERSKTTGLTVDTNVYNLDSPKGKILQDILKNHATRLQDLTIRYPTYGGRSKPFLDSLPTSTPKLRALRLIMEKAGGEPIRLPDDKFSDAQLFTLELKDCTIDWNSSLFTGLKSIKITNNNSSTSLSDFLDALKKLPKLETLDLDNALPAGSLPSTTLPVVLSSLKQLSISSGTLTITNTLRCLAIPTCAQLDLRCTHDGIQQIPDTQWDDLSSAMNRLFSLMIAGDKTPPYYSFSISRTAITAWRKPWTPASFSRARTDRPNFSLRHHASESSLTKLIAATPLSHIKTLSLSTYLKRDSLVSNFGDLPMLGTFVFDGDAGAASQVIKALTHWKTSATASNECAPFPHLEHLVMYNVIFSEQEVDYITLDDLRDCCMGRFERGAPLRKVSIYDSYDIYDNDIQLLEEIVVDVDWDGQEQEYEDEEDEEEYDDEYMSDEDDEYYGYEGYDDPYYTPHWLD